MNLDAFKSSLVAEAPPSDLDVPLQALWWDGKGDWTRAHECAQADESDPRTAWVHAFLHRKEGDIANAGYWYRRAAKPVQHGDLDAEWAAIVSVLLDAGTGH